MSLKLLQLVLMAVLAVAAASPVHAALRSAADVRLAQQRFEAAANALRKEILLRTDLSEAQRERLRAVQFVYERASLPRVRNERRFGVVRVMVNDGWLALAEDMLRAAALGRRDGACLAAYQAEALPVAQNNRKATAAQRTPRISAVPRLALVLERLGSEQADRACGPRALQRLYRPAVNEAVASGLDATLAWVVSRQIALLLATPVPRRCDDLLADQRASVFARDAGFNLALAAPAVRQDVALMDSVCLSGAERLRHFEDTWLPAPR